PAPFEPDTLLPSQYFDRLRVPHRSGEFRLMMAILEDAVRVFRTHAARGGPEFADAEAWFDERDDTYVFSFESICDIAGLDAGYLRRGLRAWKAEAHGRPAAPTSEAPIHVEPLRRASGE